MKILPQLFANDPDRLDAFRARGSDSGVAEPSAHRRDLRRRGVGWHARIVLELVEGQTLADDWRGPMPLTEALGIARRSPTRWRPRTNEASSIAI